MVVDFIIPRQLKMVALEDLVVVPVIRPEVVELVMLVDFHLPKETLVVQEEEVILELQQVVVVQLLLELPYPLIATLEDQEVQDNKLI